ncbi:hypothetical protein [Actinoplanes derwentensis]|uniref:Uncharacterized protein n=1 Tax=Actinoplanes derwentensis TaxID=113562 RepID=A0A1H1V3K0_9ACTN|nr:hypothetical protein [Actinoplanes derwentensis]GID90514.1 hypothetical protein Ade03nite_94380 [Actinoplanes derwentensis]SDS79220.1 hypothetical protein SAMN04489716_1627 [Actinoplanes derwentensis]
MALNGLRANRLSILVGAVEKNYECTSVAISSEDTDAGFVSFADTSDGKSYSLVITVAQGDTLSLVGYNNAGETRTVTVDFNRMDGSKIRVTGTVTVAATDGTVFGGDVDKSGSALFTSEMTWPFLAKPTQTLIAAP